MSEQASDGNQHEDINLIHRWPWSMIKIDLQYEWRNKQSLFDSQVFGEHFVANHNDRKLGNHDLKMEDLHNNR